MTEHLSKQAIEKLYFDYFDQVNEKTIEIEVDALRKQLKEKLARIKANQMNTLKELLKHIEQLPYNKTIQLEYPPYCDGKYDINAIFLSKFFKCDVKVYSSVDRFGIIITFGQRYDELIEEAQKKLDDCNMKLV